MNKNCKKQLSKNVRILDGAFLNVKNLKRLDLKTP